MEKVKNPIFNMEKLKGSEYRNYHKAFRLVHINKIRHKKEDIKDDFLNDNTTEILKYPLVLQKNNLGSYDILENSYRYHLEKMWGSRFISVIVKEDIDQIKEENNKNIKKVFTR